MNGVECRARPTDGGGHLLRRLMHAGCSLNAGEQRVGWNDVVVHVMSSLFPSLHHPPPPFFFSRPAISPEDPPSDFI